MKDGLTELKLAVQAWAQQAHAQGLLSMADVDELLRLQDQTPASLFDVDERPLVVGFFGGTGVGKSTLLNRLAAETIARAGVERPTSREVTLYHHTSVTVDHLPQEFPVDRIRIAAHSNPDYRHVLWIDMPDYDSIESTNRALVDDWLPHIDLLIYVVSPERYRDDQGWRLLLEHGYRHAWIFVINHWDQGDPVQLTDFRSLLELAGLSDPMLFCTDSSGADTSDDQFAQLRSSILSLADRNTIDQLEARGVSVRATEMQVAVGHALSRMGNEAGFLQLQQHWTTGWPAQARAIAAALQWKLPALTAPYAKPSNAWLDRFLPGQSPGTSVPSAFTVTTTDDGPGGLSVEMGLFDDEAVTQVVDAIDSLLAESGAYAVPHALLKKQFEPVKLNLLDKLNQIVQQQLSEALANPGAPMQRLLYQVSGGLKWLLPLASVSWAGYRIVHAFYLGGSTPAQYLGSNFAVNALLLLALAWVVPAFIHRLSRPSLVKAAEQGYQRGLTNALALVQQRIEQQLQQALNTRNDAEQRARSLLMHASQPSAKLRAELTRTLLQKPHPAD